MKKYTLPEYHVYKGRITSSSLSTFKTLYLGFDKDVAERIYNQYKTDNLVHIETQQFTINAIEL
jgi:hypothetical protein